MNKKHSQKQWTLIKLAFKNVRTNLWINLKMCFIFACLAFLICLFTVYNIALKERKTETIEYSISANYVFFTGSQPKDIQNLVETYLSDAEYIKAKYLSFDERIFMAQSEQKASFTSNRLVIKINNQMLESDDEKVSATVYSDNIFTKNDKIEMKRRYGSDELIIGKLPENNNEIVLSQPLLESFGLTESCIGSEVSLYIKNEDDPFLEGTISGIVKSEFYSLIGHLTFMRCGIIINEAHPIFKQEEGRVRHLYVLDEWLDADTAKIINNSKMVYAGNSLVRWVFNLDNIQIIANNLYYIIGVTIIIALLLTIFLMVDKYIRIFSRSSGILLSLGLERKKVYNILILQLLIICIWALPIAFVLTAFGYRVINFVLMRINGIDMSISLLQFLDIFSVGIVSVILISLVFFVYSIFKLRGQTVKQFLNTEIK